MTSVLWLRRDLRRDDLPALAAAAAEGDVVPLYVVDPAVAEAAGTRLDALRDALAGATADYDGDLCIRRGEAEEVVAQVVAETGASSVHVTAELTPWTLRRDQRVREALDVPLVVTGTAYAVAPGEIRNGNGTPYKVFTPFSKAWRDAGSPPPQPVPAGIRFRRVEGDGSLEPGSDVDWSTRWAAFLDVVADYKTDRDRPDLDGTSRMSEALTWGRVHPRTLLADLAAHPDHLSDGAHTFVTELAWREFYADVLYHHPHSAWSDLTGALAGLEYDDPADADVAARVEAWQQGRTGYPIVDAGMRQLIESGWMHNRLRMITASFLTKDLHVHWPVGARFFLEHLRDGDLASNNHGWQWVAGTGTDPSPYFRVFNPVTQGQKFDPDGAFVRRWVPELAHVPGKAVHQPWQVPDGYAGGYPEPVVEHDQERKEALARYEQVRSRR